MGLGALGASGEEEGETVCCADGPLPGNLKYD